MTDCCRKSGFISTAIRARIENMGQGRMLLLTSHVAGAFFKFTHSSQAGSFAFRPIHEIFDAQTDPRLFNRATKELRAHFLHSCPLSGGLCNND